MPPFDPVNPSPGAVIVGHLFGHATNRVFKLRADAVVLGREDDHNHVVRGLSSRPTSLPMYGRKSPVLWGMAKPVTYFGMRER